MLEISEVNLSLHPKQAFVLESQATEILYGGAAGGGKSHLFRVLAIKNCVEVPTLSVYLFRRTKPELDKNHMEGPTSFRAMLAPWVNSGHVEIVEDEIRFWNGSKIFLCHCRDEKDIYKYQGAEIHLLLIDELTHFTETQYRYLRGRVRMANIVVPESIKGTLPRIVAGTNPGGTGHIWVKEAWIDSSPPYDINRMPENEGGFYRQFVPATLDDNPSLVGTGYEGALQGIGSETLVQALRYGRWDICEGAFFSEFRRELHVIEPFNVPESWPRFTAMDWGSARPFCVLWFAIADGEYITKIPRGALVVYREWYGGSKNIGLKLPVENVAKGIEIRQKIGEKKLIRYNRADPSMFKEDGGPSHAERMYKATGIRLSPADNQRIPGWDNVRARLQGEDGKPMLYFFNSCLNLIRTLPYLQHDDSKIEDLNTEMEDHAADALRYGCMSRPYIRLKEVVETPFQKIGRILKEKENGDTFNALWAEHMKMRKKRERRLRQ